MAETGTALDCVGGGGTIRCVRDREAYADISARTDCPEDLESVVARADTEDGADVDVEGAGEAARRLSYFTVDCSCTHFFVLSSCMDSFR